MKKRFATMLAATAVLGVTTAFAANPFSDVTPNDWAYQSVSQLASAGIINGYPDGTFKGQNNITRYEMAQMVAKAMANQSRATAEQQAMINRLANEFSDELNNLGVRVSELENKVGNVKVTGDARLRYQGSDEKGVVSSSNRDKKSMFDYRARVQFNAQVNDNTSAVVRVTSGNNEFGNGVNNSTDISIDRAYVAHQFGANTTGIIGRYNAFVGNGLIYDDTFDGAALAYDNGNFSATAAYGSFVEGGLGNSYANGNEYTRSFEEASSDDNATVTLLQAKGKLGEHATLGGFYAFGNKNLNDDIYGGSLDLNFDKVWLGGEYAQFKDADDGSAWVAGIGYGDYNIEKAGTWGAKVQYFNEDTNSPVISSTFNQPYNADYKAWMASVDYSLAKNVGLSAYYAFSAEDQKGNELPDYYRAELNYKF